MTVQATDDEAGGGPPQPRSMQRNYADHESRSTRLSGDRTTRDNRTHIHIYK